jgi:hypothetical protein
VAAVHHELQQLADVQVGRACAVFRVVIQLRHVSLSGVSLRFCGSGHRHPTRIEPGGGGGGFGVFGPGQGVSTIIELGDERIFLPWEGNSSAHTLF